MSEAPYNSNGGRDDEVVKNVYCGVEALSKRLGAWMIAACGADGSDRLASVEADLEFAVYCLFKIDYVACGRLPEHFRTQLVGECERLLAQRFHQLGLGANYKWVHEVVMSRMDAYSERVAFTINRIEDPALAEDMARICLSEHELPVEDPDHKPTLFDMLSAIARGLANFLMAIESLAEIQKEPPIVVKGDFGLRMALFHRQLLEFECREGLGFMYFFAKVFTTHPQIFSLSDEQLRDFYDLP